MNLEQEWAEMEARSLGGEGLLAKRVRPDSPQDIYIAVEKARLTRLMLLNVDADAVPVNFRPVRAKGIHLYFVSTADQRRSLRLELTLSQFSEIFSNLVRDVIERVAESPTQQDAVRVFIQRLQHWKVLLGKDSAQILSHEQQMGLFGELHILRSIALPAFGALTSVMGWEGPYGADQDYRLPPVILEVKTGSVTTYPVAFRVASERQLASSSAKPLVLCFVALNLDDKDAGETLGEVVSSVRSLLLHEPTAASLFEERLAAAGYFEVHSDHYTSRHAVDGVRTFLVDGGFPRVTPDGLPQGVFKLSYSVALNACAPFELTSEELRGFFIQGEG